MEFKVVVLNEKIEIDEIIVECENYISALLKAENIFCSKHLELKYLDSGMLIGSKARDLTVLNKDSLKEKFYLLKIEE